MKKVKHIVVRNALEFEQQVNQFLINYDGSRVIGYSSMLVPEKGYAYEQHYYSALIEYSE